MTTTASPYRIDRDVPIPEKRRTYSHYPWRQLQVGDSFAVPLNGRTPRRVAALVTSAWVSVRRRSPELRFTCRQEQDAIRVWRIA